MGIGGQLEKDLDVSIDMSSSNPNLDAFNRLRVSTPETIFDSSFRWDKQPVTWCELTASGGTVVHNSDTVSIDLSVTTTTGSSAIFQSRQYVRYHPGKGQAILITGNFNGIATSVTKRIGYFDENNGIFFQLSGSTLSVVRRTKVSGSVVDNTTAQSSWNLDRLDGTGPSGVTIDTSKQQIFLIDFQWLGSGRIRYGIVAGGKIIYCHQDNNANVLTTPWSQTGDAPIRASISNAGSTSSSMHITCCAVLSEGTWAPDGILRTVNLGSTPRAIGSVGSVIPALSLRKKSAYLNVPIKIEDLTVLGNSSDDTLITLIFNGSLTGASWTSLSGVAEYDRSATAISGGTPIYSSYLRGTNGSASSVLLDIFKEVKNAPLGQDLSGNSDIFSVVITAITNNPSVYLDINYRELL